MDSQLSSPGEDLVIYANGQYMPSHEPVISIWDHGFLYGDGFFEGIRLFDGRIFKLAAHLDRFYQSAQFLCIDVPVDRDELQAIIVEVVRRNHLRDAHIRPIVTRGVGEPALGHIFDLTPSLFVLANPHPSPARLPLRCMISTVRRKAPASVDARVKSLNYLDSILARIQALAAGYDDAIMLDDRGLVAEGTGANLFLVDRGVLVTPTTEASLAGVTRQTVIEIAQEQGFAVVQRPVTPGDVYLADELFFTGTGQDIAPIGEVDRRRIGNGRMGAVTARVADRYDQLKVTGDVLDVYA
ncbi:MAG: branched-chain-amino-acid transaminase [Sulfobacillus acidophilus]|uniref:Branched-chain-amino-acid aminotransferase n=1 Tax=Sulfobacillus acidophilus TaxID=53633 RepID=A0A2T2WCN7_9FIRM|nr:MAG: branched-chain-amino-acid transaminase [Sulfobacillus acidophilus]